MEASADLLFDFEEGSHECSLRADDLPSQNAAVETMVRKVEALTRHPSELARQLQREVVVLINRFDAGLSSTQSLLRLASALTVLGYDVALRTVLGGGTGECFRYLRHKFLVVRGTGDFAAMEFIVEPFLRQHFAIPHPSPDYQYVLSRIPDVFVGGSCRLVPVVQLLCALMADSFSRQGLPLPPWRREAAMLSKWLPNTSRFHDSKPASAVQHGPVQSFFPLGLSSLSRPTANGNGAVNPNAVDYVSEQHQVLKGVPPAVDASAPFSAEQAQTLGVHDICKCPAQPDCAAPGLASDAATGGASAADAFVAIPLATMTPSRLMDGLHPAASAPTSAAIIVGFDLGYDLGRAPCRASKRFGNTTDPANGSHDPEAEKIQDVIQLPTAIPLPPLPLLPDSHCAEMEDDDHCTSPCLNGASSAEYDDSGSFRWGSSSASSLLYGEPDSLLGSPAAGGARRAGIFTSVFGLNWQLPTARRPTVTGMLPCSGVGTGVLNAKLLLEPLAVAAAAAAAGVSYGSVDDPSLVVGMNGLQSTGSGADGPPALDLSLTLIAVAAAAGGGGGGLADLDGDSPPAPLVRETFDDALVAIQ